MTTIDDLAPYLADPYFWGHENWYYDFPNGHSVSVSPDPERPFRFEVKVDRNDPIRGLATDQVEAVLLRWYSLSPEEPTVAFVFPVALGGELQADTVVSVGEWSWPVAGELPDLTRPSPGMGWAEPRGRERPVRSMDGAPTWMHRVVRTLRNHGWKATGDPRLAGGPGVYEVPIERFETGED